MSFSRAAGKNQFFFFEWDPTLRMKFILLIIPNTVLIALNDIFGKQTRKNQLLSKLDVYLTRSVYGLTPNLANPQTTEINE